VAASASVMGYLLVDGMVGFDRARLLHQTKKQSFFLQRDIRITGAKDFSAWHFVQSFEINEMIAGSQFRQPRMATYSPANKLQKKT
jgi:hypothetical protein